MLAHKPDGLIDARAVVIGQRGCDIARIAHDQDRVSGRACTAQHGFAPIGIGPGIVHLDQPGTGIDAIFFLCKLHRIVEILVLLLSHGTIEERTHPFAFVVGEDARFHQQDIVERLARTGDAAAFGQIVYVHGLVTLGIEVGDDHAEPRIARFGIGSEPAIRAHSRPSRPISRQCSSSLSSTSSMRLKSSGRRSTCTLPDWAICAVARK